MGGRACGRGGIEVGCPKCDGRIEFSADGGWACTCGFARPVLNAWIETGTDAVALVWRDGGRQAVELEIPGEFNRANAAMAVVAASAVGVPRAVGLEAVAGIQAVAGRFSTPLIDGVATRLMLAKNPAGWTELLSLVCPGTAPVVVGVDSRVADGRDPSWLWDVDFALLAGRPVIATGERCLDLAVRLRYADVVHRTIRQPEVAIAAAGAERPGKRVEFIGNYRPSTTWWPGGERPVDRGGLPRPVGHLGDGGNGAVLARRAAWPGPRSDSSRHLRMALCPPRTSIASVVAKTVPGPRRASPGR